MPGFVAFLSVAIVLIITPGQDMALTMKNVLRGGRRFGLFTSLGMVSGLFIWTLAASAGLAALLLASEPAFLAVKAIGVAYLIFLGAQSLLCAWRSDKAVTVDPVGQMVNVPSMSVAYRQGLISNLSNPKIAVFFTSLLPQFTPSGEATFGSMLLLGSVFCVLRLSWLGLYASIVAKAGDILRQSRVRRVLDALVGVVLIALGIRLATAQR